MNVRRTHWTLLLVSIATIAIFGCGGEIEQPSSSAPAKTIQATDPVVPLADGAWAAEISGRDFPEKVQPGSTFAGTVTVTNRGTVTWPSVDVLRTEPRGAGAVRLGLRWWKETDPMPPASSAYLAFRSDLPRSLNPGESIDLPVEVTAPVEPGRYNVQIDLVQELVAWFSTRGSDPLTVQFEVAP